MTGSPGRTAAVGAAEPPSSSPVRLATRIGKATWSGRSDWRGSKARTAAGRPARTPAYRRGALFVPGMTARAQAGSVRCRASAMCVVDRSTKRRIGSSVPRLPMAGFASTPPTSPSPLLIGGAIARIGVAASVAGTYPSKMIRSQLVPSLRTAPAGYSAGVSPKSRLFGRYDRAVSRYGSPLPTTRTLRVRCGGTTAHARSSAASRSGRASGSASSAATRRTSIVAASAGTSSTMTSARCWASIGIVRVSIR